MESVYEWLCRSKGFLRKTLPQAQVVHDRFYLVKYLNGAIDKVRRREVKKHDELKSSRYALLKNKQNLTQTQRIKFEAIQLQRPNPKDSFGKDSFGKMFKTHTSGVVEALIHSLSNAMADSKDSLGKD